MNHSVPDHVNPIQWHQALAVSRQECARVFRDGGEPNDALVVFGLSSDHLTTWERAVDQIATELCAHPVMTRAAA